MRTLALLIALAPIRLCGFGNPPDCCWDDTWDGRDSGITRGQTDIYVPRDGERLEAGTQIELMGVSWFGNTAAEEVLVRWQLDNTEICLAVTDAFSETRCPFIVPNPDGEVHTLQLIAVSRLDEVREAAVRVSFVDSQPDPDTDADTDTSAPATPSLRVDTPSAGSVWTEGQPVPFVVRVGADTPVNNARVVWEIDGLQNAALTTRTNTDGIGVSATVLAPGPHEAVATVVVGGTTLSVPTRFRVGADTQQDPP